MASSITVPHNLMLDRILTMEIVRVTERAAVNAARLRGRGQEKAADQAAVDAMRRELNKLPIDGTVVIGEGEMDEAPMLFIGEKVGAPGGFKVDIAVDPLEGTTLCAKNMPGAIATIAIAEGGTLLHAPDIYMDKIAVGPGYPKDVIDLDAPAEENIRALAKAKGVKPEGITAMLLDRPRHADMIAAMRKTGAAVSLITDGDVAAVIHTTEPEKTGIEFSSASAARRKGFWRRPHCAASAARCNAASWSIPMKNVSGSPRWASRIRAGDIRSRIWCAAIVCLLRPASPTAVCSTASSSATALSRRKRW